MDTDTFYGGPMAEALESDPGVLGLTPKMLNLLTIHVEEAVARPREEPVRELNAHLTASLRLALARAPTAVVNAIQASEQPATNERIAYLLGQVGMAQALTARACDRRISDDFIAALKSAAFASYIHALLEGPLTNIELAEVTGERVETVSRKLKKLRDIGAAEFRREGVLVHNFLTPAAEALAKVARGQTALPKPKRHLNETLVSALGALDPHWKTNPNFSNEDTQQSIVA